MSANPTFNPDDPRQALAMLDAILSGDNMNFNRTVHNAIGRAIVTLRNVIEGVDGLEANLKTQKELIDALRRDLPQDHPLAYPASETSEAIQ